MVGTIVEGLMSEIRAHPYTTIAAMIALAGVTIMAPGEVRSAKLDTRIAALETEVRFSQAVTTARALEAEVRRLDQAIFDIEARINEIRKTGSEPDHFYFDRLREMTSDKAQVERKLAEYTRIHPELLESQ